MSIELTRRLKEAEAQIEKLTQAVTLLSKAADARNPLVREARALLGDAEGEEGEEGEAA